MQEKESKKTLTFVLVAGMALLVAWEPWRPAPIDTSVPERVGQRLFSEFTDPLAANSLEIVTFDEKIAAIRDFKVAQTDGVWSIPSHSNYPADATQHMAEAATALMDLKILSVESDNPGDQKTYGVITPDPKTLKVGMTGVGRRVTVRDGKDKVLADLVIGEPVKGSPALRYVREANRDPIYTVAIRDDQFSTRFGDWIEKDLLKLNAFDVRELTLNDYSSQPVVGADGRAVLQLDKRSEIELSYDDTKSEWQLVEMREFGDQGQPHAVELAEDEELNSQKLNDLRSALDDLQIVNVQRKPAGLSRDLRVSDEFLTNNEAVQSLAERGFIPIARPGKPPEIYSSEGEVICTTKDGVRYVLRFGDVAGASMPGETDEEGNDKESGPSRYLFLMAELDEAQIPKPELEPLPGDEKPAGDEPEEKGETPDSPEETGEESADEKPADEPQAAEQKPEETKTSAQEPESADAPPADTSPVDDEPAPPADDDAKGADTPQDAEEKPTTPEEEQRIAIQRENKRKQDEYDAAVKRGQDKVKELNDRFADWYFIISDDEYKKIHLSRGDIIRQKKSDDADPDQVGSGVEGLPGVGGLQQFEGGLGDPDE